METGAASIVRLNVGGQIFCTTKATLCGATSKRSFFHGLLDGDIPSTRDETGAFFIDRDPETFRLLLQWLRSGVLPVPTEPSTLQLMRVEAEFFGLELPVESASNGIVLLHVFGGATTNNFVKAVQVDVYGAVSKDCQHALSTFLDAYEQRTNNVFELPVVKTQPAVSSLIMCSCLDLGLVFSLANIIAMHGWKISSHSTSLIPDAPHQKTQSTFTRRDFHITFEPRHA